MMARCEYDIWAQSHESLPRLILLTCAIYLENNMCCNCRSCGAGAPLFEPFRLSCRALPESAPAVVCRISQGIADFIGGKLGQPYL